MITINEALERLLTEDLMPDDQINPKYFKEASDEYSNLVLKMLDELSREELFENLDDSLDFNKHYTKHCMTSLGGKSIRTSVKYDFTSEDEYRNRINFIDSLTPDFIVSDTHSKVLIDEALNKLLSGNCCILFLGIKNRYGEYTDVKLHSFSNDVTTNFSGDTFDYLIYDESGIKMTLYPITMKFIERWSKKLINTD